MLANADSHCLTMIQTILGFASRVWLMLILTTTLRFCFAYYPNVRKFACLANAKCHCHTMIQIIFGVTSDVWLSNAVRFRFADYLNDRYTDLADLD